MNLATNLVNSARRTPEAIALRLDEDEWSYARLDEATARFAAHLRRRGLVPGDRLAMTLPNIPAFAVVYYGALRAGLVVVPMNPLFRVREADHYLRDAEVALLVAPSGLAAVDAAEAATVPTLLVEDLPEVLAASEPDHRVEDRDGESLAVLLYTSGTTGEPKGAELTHANLESNRLLVEETLVEPEPGDVVLGCLPLFHVFGMTCALNMSIAAGTTLTLIARFDPARAVEIIGRDRVSVFFGVPTMYGAMLAALPTVPGADVSSLRRCVSGGASLPVEVMRKFEEAFGAIILEGYGLSETSPVASFNHPHEVRKPGSIGTAVRGVEMTLLPVEGEDTPTGEGIGEIGIRGSGLMRGYWRQPEATATVIPDDGWLRTGDLARVDEDGYYFIVDRSKDVINRNGYNVYPREVEDVVYEFPGVAEAAVVGLPDERVGEEITAFVVTEPGTDVDPDALTAYVKERVAPYKYPRSIRFLDALPKGATGKILKRELRRL